MALCRLFPRQLIDCFADKLVFFHYTIFLADTVDIRFHLFFKIQQAFDVVSFYELANQRIEHLCLFHEGIISLIKYTQNADGCYIILMTYLTKYANRPYLYINKSCKTLYNQ